MSSLGAKATYTVTMAVPYMCREDARGSNRAHNNIGAAVFAPFIQQAYQDGGTAPLTNDGQDTQTSQARRYRDEVMTGEHLIIS